MVTRKLVILKQPLILVMSEINLPLSPTNLFFTDAVCFEEIDVSKAVFNLFRYNFCINIQQRNWSPVFYVTFTEVFFTMSLMTACFCKILKVFVLKA